MNRETVRFVQFLHAVNSFTDNVHYSSFNLSTDRHCNCLTGWHDFHSALQSIRAVHCHGTNSIFTNVLLHFHHQCAAIVSYDSHRIVDLRQSMFRILAFKFEVYIDYRTDYLRNVSNDF